MFALGAVAVLAPLFSSVWGMAILGVAILLSGVVELVDAWVLGGRRLHFSSGAFSVLAGALISFQNAFVFSGLVLVVSVVLLADGAVVLRYNAESFPTLDLLVARIVADAAKHLKGNVERAGEQVRKLFSISRHGLVSAAQQPQQLKKPR